MQLLTAEAFGKLPFVNSEQILNEYFLSWTKLPHWKQGFGTTEVECHEIYYQDVLIAKVVAEEE